MEQLTLEDAERQWHIARLECSMQKWRDTGLNERMPDDYARYCHTLDVLKSDGEYRVRRFDPVAFCNSIGEGRAKTLEACRAPEAHPAAAILGDIAMGIGEWVQEGARKAYQERKSRAALAAAKEKKDRLLRYGQYTTDGNKIEGR